MTRRFVIAAVAAATAIQRAAAEIACNSGFVEFTCPDTHPICCSWPQNHVVAACCPADSVCALNEGRCLIMPGHSPNATQANDQGGVTVGVSEAAAFITFAAIGFIVALVGCSFLGFKMFLVAEGHRQRRQEAERQALLAGSDDDDGEQGDGDGESSSEPDDEGQCNICYSHHINCVLMPCAHVATCRMCAGRLEKCPICREDVSKFIPLKTRIFTSKQSTGGKRTGGGKGSAGQEAPTSARSLELQESARVPAAAAASAGSRAASARQAVEEADTDERPTVVADATVNAAAADTVSVDNDNGSSAAAVVDVAAPADEDEHVAASEEVSPRGASTVE